MTKEKLEELWLESWVGLPESIDEATEENNHRIALLSYSRKLLFECAKMACINCKDGSPSLATNDPNHRIHQLTPKWPEACRAPSFFITGE